MNKMKLYFATNRKHEGGDRWKPDRYTDDYSSNGRHNLRFGELVLKVDDSKVSDFARKMRHGQRGDGEGLSDYLSDQANVKQNIKISTYEEDLTKKSQLEGLTSTRAFGYIKERMEQSSDVLVFIHGFNVKWCEAVGSALALQHMLNRNNEDSEEEKEVMVFLFSWPSEGSARFFIDYWSDRKTAEGSGPAVGRAILKLHNFLCWLNDKVKSGDALLCKRDIHLLCHSMGNYVLQNALPTVLEHVGGQSFPRLFEHIFLCASDVDDDVLEPGQPMGSIHSLARRVSVYHNNHDVALTFSDKTKGNPDRLGHGGVARPGELHRKVQQIDCTPVVGGIVEHRYFLWATVNDDIRMTIDNIPPNIKPRRRVQISPNSWEMKK